MWICWCIFIYGYESKYKVWIKAPDPHTIHTPRSIPWSIPHDTAWSIPLIHTPDPYPWSVPFPRWRKTDAGPNAAFYLILLLVLVLLLPLLLPLFLLLPLLPPLPPRAAAAAAAATTSLLVIFLPGAAATAVASAAAPAGLAPAAGADSLPPCACGSWTNATSWLATSKYCTCTLDASKTGSSSTRCFLYFYNGAMITIPSVSALPGTCRTRPD